MGLRIPRNAAEILVSPPSGFTYPILFNTLVTLGVILISALRAWLRNNNFRKNQRPFSLKISVKNPNNFAKTGSKTMPIPEVKS